MSRFTPLDQQLWRMNLAKADRALDYRLIANPPFTQRKLPGLRRVKTDAVQIYTWKDFLTASECSEIIKLIDANAEPSTVVANARGGNPYAYDARRTSKSCYLAEHVAPVAKKVDRKIADAIGFDLSHADSIQAQKYDAGDEFRPHHDYFEPGTPGYDNFCGEKGQRSWTFMIYLNDVKNGGATVFPAIHRSFKPKAGMAIVWNNLLPDGPVNPATIHGGAPVKAGVKYIITKWFRERGNGSLLAPEFR